MQIMNVQNWLNGLKTGKRMIFAYMKHCRDDQLSMVAGYLAFISLLSVVPMISVVFSVLKAFPVFESFKNTLETFIFTNFVPTSSDQIQLYINNFVDNASKMTAIGISALILVAIQLIASIDKTLNHIFNTRRTRKWVFSFAIYWMVLTLGPILVGASLVATSYIISIAAMADTYTPGLSDFFIKLLPFIMSTLAFVLLFMVVPNTEVKFKAALSGAVLAGVLFELSKRGFALYITSFPSYQVIYGALAAIPILFIWVYLSWYVVLLGAEFTVFIDPFFADEQALGDEETYADVGESINHGNT
jgi:membrane protein